MLKERKESKRLRKHIRLQTEELGRMVTGDVVEDDEEYPLRFPLDSQLTRIYPGVFAWIPDNVSLFEDSFTIIMHLVERGVEIPLHWHEWEEAIFVAEGKMRVELENGTEETVILDVGDSLKIPENTPHRMIALEPCQLVSVTRPPLEKVQNDEAFQTACP